MAKKRFSLLTEDMTTCIETGEKGNIHIHEVFFGTADRKKSIEWGCCIPLIERMHDTNFPTSIHNDKGMNYRYKRLMQKAFEEKYGHEKFMEVFIKNNLEESEMVFKDE